MFDRVLNTPIAEVYSEPFQTSQMKRFVKIVKS